MNENEFEAISSLESGFYAEGEVIRSLELMPSSMGPVLLLGNYGDLVSIYLYLGIQEN